MAGYKVDKMEIESWRLARSRKGRNETLNEEPSEETWLKMDEIPEQELHVNEAMQPQYLGNTKLLPSRSISGEFNSLPNQEAAVG